MESAMNTGIVEKQTSSLVVPNGWYELDREEMSYVEGGFALRTWMVSAPIDIALMCSGVTLAFGGVKILGRLFGKKIARSLCKGMAPIITKVVSAVSSGVVNITVGQLGQALFDNFWKFTSAGNLVAGVLDYMFDRRFDGIIYEW